MKKIPIANNVFKIDAGKVVIGEVVVELYVYMFLHQEENKIYIVPYQEQKKWGSLVFVQRGEQGQRHLVFDLAPEFLNSKSAESTAKFYLEKIKSAPKLFDISDWPRDSRGLFSFKICYN